MFFYYEETDAEADAYIKAVEIADGQALESNVRKAITRFVLECKKDGIWSAIKTSCILAGARTLDGALTPLVGTAPTNFNFVANDYNRKTGLLGNGMTKYLDSNRLASADGNTNHHIAVYPTTYGSGGAMSDTQGTQILLGNTNFLDSRPNGTGRIILNSPYLPNNLVAISRNEVKSFRGRISAKNYSATYDFTIPSPVGTYKVFRNMIPQYANYRMSFYSIGSDVNLQLLDKHVTILMTAIGAAIP